MKFKTRKETGRAPKHTSEKALIYGREAVIVNQLQ